MAKKIRKGNVLEELVKGSLDYTMQLIREAFRNQFPSGDGSMSFYINEIFSDHVIVSDWSSPSVLKTDEYWKVTYSQSDGSYTFASRDEWEIVELAYQPQTVDSGQQSAVSEGKKAESGKQNAEGGKQNAEGRRQMAEGGKQNAEGRKQKKGQRIEERIEAVAVLEEAQEGKPRKIRIDGAMTADVVNGNKRRYPSAVLKSAVEELRGHLNESAGQGRAIQILGEAEHPSDKGGRPNLLETVTKWDDVSFNGEHVDLVGRVLETSKGKDILTLMESGVMPGVSMRGYGEGRNVKQGDDKIFEVAELHITGFDLVLEPSFENIAELFESQSSMEDDMNELLEQLKKLLAEHPELFNKGMNEAQLEALNEKQLKKLDESLRSALGIDPNANIIEAVKVNADKARKFDEGQKQAEVTKAIEEATKDLPFGKKLNEMFVASMKEANLASVEAVKQFAESKRTEYGKLAAAGVLKGMGFDEKTKSIKMIGDVLENETGTPSFAQISFQLIESVRKHDNRAKSAIQERAESAASILTQKLLERFDSLNQRQLMAESLMLQEAELTTDLNLPYSVSRAVIEEVFPNLVAANIFDVGTIETSPTRLYYETTTGETGYTVVITDEVEVAGAEEVWYNLTHGRITPGGVTVTSNPAGTTYVEGTDYVINYADGKVKALAAGSIGSNDILVDYTYSSIRNGEMAPIERVKTTLAFKVIEAAADRLADQISREAIVFSRSQLGWDAVARTMANLIRQMRRHIDLGLLYMAYSAVMGIPNNSTPAWNVDTTQDSLAELYRLLGNASVIVAKRYYEPTFYLASITNTDRLSNWEGFKRDGFPQSLLNAAGFVGGVKGKPVFASTEFPDGLWIIGNRELVQHRVFLPLSIKGPFPTYEASTNKLIAADQYYAEEFNATESLVHEKGAYVPVTEEEGS